MTNDEDILNRDDKNIDDNKIIKRDDSWMKDIDVLNIKYDEWKKK